MRGEQVGPAIYTAAIDGLRSQPGGAQIDTIVLACTHFPLVEKQLREAAGPEVTFVHGATGIARQVARLTSGQAFERSVPDHAIVTGDAPAPPLASLAAHGLESVERF